MDIALYISELLQKHEELSVTGLGTFYKKRTEAYYDEQLQSFIPPSKKLAYSPEYHPDPRLTEYISQRRNISAASSEHFIGQFADEIGQQLESGQRAEIEHVGILSKKEDGVAFVVSPDFPQELAEFGLRPVKEVQLPDVPAPRDSESIVVAAEADRDEQEKVEETDEPAISPETPDQNRSTAVPAIIEAENPVPELKPAVSDPNWDPVILNEIHEPSGEVEEPAKRRRFPVVLLILVLLASAIAAVYVLAPETLNRYLKQQPEKKAIVPVIRPKTLSDSVTVADSIIQSLNEQGFEVEKPRDTITISTDAKPAEAANIRTFEVIGASLNSQADAEQLVKNFKSRGIDARIILAKDKKRNNILISLGSFNNKEAAGAELIRIKNDIEPGAYIYTYNPN